MKTMGTLLLVIMTFHLHGQVEKHVQEFNALLQGRCHLEWSKKNVILSVSDGSKLLRTDEFRPDYLDSAKIEYSATENAVVLYCREGYEGCFDRKIIKTKNHSRYSRSTILVSGSEEGQKVLSLWKSIIRLENQE